MRAIAEADIIQLHGDRLYALSRMSGVNVVDVGDPARLRLLGRFGDTRDAEPFEMYVRDDVAFVMFSGWGKYVQVESTEDGDEPAYAWVQTSELVALDIADPAQIAVIDSFEIPGQISDSRVVGDVLYVVGYQDGYCWNCEQNRAQTSVVSLDIADPRAIAKVDELSFRDDDNAWGWNRRSVTVTHERMYVAGPEYGNGGPVGSSIQVVDIADAGGEMTLGASVSAAGQITSRWQMDEHEGVLRVISQPPQWDLQAPPVIQTFTVTSPDEVTPLGRADMRLPRPEQLQSVRFDGLRAYAITFERTDPLFTIDLSDPAAPRQVGELEIPGFVYHMEPRGDRVLGLGFDQGNAEGSITVSIFDVSDMAAPTMLDRVNFGGDWGQLPEDQDRIHKVFRVLDEDGLILVPHTGHDSRRDDACWYSATSGVQLVDFTRDALALRGSLPSRSQARRAFVASQHVFTVSDEQLESFEIADRSAPVLRGSLPLARNVMRAVQLSGDVVARFSNDWWSEHMTIELVSAADAHLPAAALGQIDFGEVLQVEDTCQGYAWVRDAFADGDRLILIYQAEDYTRDAYRTEHGVAVIDASDPAAPRLAGRHTWQLEDGRYPYDGFYTHGIPVSTRGTARFDGGVAMLEYDYVSWTEHEGEQARVVLRIVDLRDPSAITTRTLELPGRHGYAGLRLDGTTLYTSHFEPIEGAAATRFYLDRIDVADPADPRRLPSINVPGVVLHHDGGDDHALTMDLLPTEVERMTYQDCAERHAIFDYEHQQNDDLGPCVGYRQVLRLVEIDGDVARLQASHELDIEQRLSRLEAGDGHLVGLLGDGRGYGYGRRYFADIECWGPCGYYGAASTNPQQLLTLSGMSDGELRTGALELSAEAEPWYGWWGASDLVVAGQRALVTSRSELAIVDLSDPEHPAIERTESFSGHAQGVNVEGDRVVLSLGAQGCRVVDM
jgi:hypothetical protein